MPNYYHIAIAPGIHYDCVDNAEAVLRKGETVVVRCDRYEDYGIVLHNYPDGYPESAGKRNSQSARRIEGSKTPQLIRQATSADYDRMQENCARARTMLRTTSRKAEEYKLQMKLVNCHLSFDCSMVIFQFTAEGRVDFRDLLRDLSRTFSLRVELRQIGVRDEAGIHGGIGTCGRAFCCATFLRKFISINVRMAKEQGLSLNPTNISGACGRLKCCLRYESSTYRDLMREMPRPGTWCETADGPAKILEVNAISNTVRVRLDGSDGRMLTLAATDIKLSASRPERTSAESAPPDEREPDGGAAKAANRSPQPRDRRRPERGDKNVGRSQNPPPPQREPQREPQMPAAASARQPRPAQPPIANNVAVPEPTNRSSSSSADAASENPAGSPEKV